MKSGGASLLVVLLLFLLFLIFLVLIVGEVVEAELVVATRGSNDAKPVTEVVLLEETLGQVLSILAAEGDVAGDGDLVARGDNVDLVLQSTSTALDLDVLLEVLSKVSDLDDLGLSVRGGSVEGDLLGLLATLSRFL